MHILGHPQPCLSHLGTGDFPQSSCEGREVGGREEELFQAQVETQRTFCCHHRCWIPSDSPGKCHLEMQHSPHITVAMVMVMVRGVLTAMQTDHSERLSYL